MKLESAVTLSSLKVASLVMVVVIDFTKNTFNFKI